MPPPGPDIPPIVTWVSLLDFIQIREKFLIGGEPAHCDPCDIGRVPDKIGLYCLDAPPALGPQVLQRPVPVVIPAAEFNHFSEAEVIEPREVWPKGFEMANCQLVLQPASEKSEERANMLEWFASESNRSERLCRECAAPLRPMI